MKERKRKIQAEFLSRLGLHVDQPRACGAGTSNDGNTAGRSLTDPAAFSDIKGLDMNIRHQELIERLRVILEAINISQLIDVQKYAEYGLKTV